jgi:hypothetical protein
MAEPGNSYTPSEKNWRAVEKTLPPNADRVRVRAELERIARDRLSPQELRQIYKSLIQNYERLIEWPPITITEEKQDNLKQETTWCKQQLAHLGVRRRKNTRMLQTLRLRAILFLWKEQGGTAPVVTNREDEPVKQYLRAAHEFVWGKRLSSSRAKKVISAWVKLFMTAKFDGAGTLRADASIIPGARAD